MADPSRFPRLTLPFAIVGASAGWLSAGLLANPLVRMMQGGKQLLTAFLAMVFAGATGALLTRWCIGKRYAYELLPDDPSVRAPGDRWWRHVTAVLAAGAATGALFAALCDTYGGPSSGAVTGLCCAGAFVPVCAAVIVTARRAQRARLGSIVADSDRRAVWGILALTLAVATLEAIPDWPASAKGEVEIPTPVIWMMLAAGLATLAILIADERALRRARVAIAPGLEQRSAADIDPLDTAVPGLDLGLGDGVLARLARSSSAYRGRDRTLALVQGSPEQALAALRRAVRRGAVSLAVIGAVAACHAAATTPRAQIVYEQMGCVMDPFGWCANRRSELLQQADAPSSFMPTFIPIYDPR